jgi:uncharacterized protein YecE (DUF72 family)
MNNLKKYQNLIHWGTSTWTYPEWEGIVYHRPYTAKTIKTESLAEYAAFKLFSTVGIDNTFYAPPNPFVLAEYARHLPPGFKCVSKVWDEFTVPKWSQQKRYGKKAGKDNPHFLDAQKFKTEVLAVYGAAFKDHTGPLVFEFGEMYPPTIPSLSFFLEKLAAFFAELPKDYQYAVEMRNKGFLKPEYFETLRRLNVSHVYNHWTKMPRLAEQMSAAGDKPFTADFAVARLLTPLGVKYEKAVEMNAPYNAIKARLPMMRDDIEELIDKALEFNIPFFILVNNRTEGCAPITVQEMDERIRSKLMK